MSTNLIIRKDMRCSENWSFCFSFLGNAEEIFC